MVDRLFDGEAPRRLLLGDAMHADLPPDAPGAMGFLMTMLGQDVGSPVPVGGSGQLTAALVHRAGAAGAEIESNQNVARIAVRGGRAVAVTIAEGQRFGCGGRCRPTSSRRGCSATCCRPTRSPTAE